MIKYLKGKFGHYFNEWYSLSFEESLKWLTVESSFLNASLAHLLRICYWVIEFNDSINNGQFCIRGRIEICSKVSSSSDFWRRLGFIDETNSKTEFGYFISSWTSDPI